MKRRILITGGHGFIGRPFIRLALERDFDVHSYDRKVATNPIAHQYVGKLTDPDELVEVLHQFIPDYIVHLAAESSIIDSWLDPASTILSNVTATKNLITAIRSLPNQPRLINISSSSVYAPKGKGKLSETDPVGPDNPYSISKFACELCVGELQTWINVRPFFVIGPGKHGDVVSDWCHQIAEFESQGPTGSHTLITGNLDIVRDFLSVQSAAEGLLYLMTAGSPRETYNLCSGSGASLRLVVNHLQDISRVRFDVLSNSREKLRRNDRIRVVGNPEKLSKLGFQSKIPLKGVLRDTLQWHREAL